MQDERTTVQSEVEVLTKNVGHIKNIVSMQQSYARLTGISEVEYPVELVEDSLRLHEAAFHRHSIKVVREFSEVPRIYADRHKIIQVLVNLLGNAKYACEVNEPTNRIIRLRIHPAGENRIRIEVSDNGVGIAPENLTRIFSYGFTTRKNGHGFGLHGGALAAQELGGSLTVQSDGPGKGATFILELPVESEPPAQADRIQAKRLERV
jgi:signal transduction histidine kinase